MSATHTPGPWSVEASDGVWVQPPDVDANVICDIVGRIYDKDARCTQITPEDEANANLIAAAPDLLEVARIEHELQMRGYTIATARRLGPEAEHAYLVGGAPGLNGWRRTKREAAIAKAEGRA